MLMFHLWGAKQEGLRREEMAEAGKSIAWAAVDFTPFRNLPSVPSTFNSSVRHLHCHNKLTTVQGECRLDLHFIKCSTNSPAFVSQSP